MAKKLLLAVLWIALVIELGLTVGSFFLPVKTLILFKLPLSADTFFMVHLTGWFLIVIDALCVASIRLVKKDDPLGWKIANLVSVWWIALGISIFVFFGRPDNLALDSAKGILILILGHYSNPKRTLTSS